MSMKAVAALAAALAMPCAWAINKCIIDGQVVFQDTACPGKGETLVVRPASGHAQPLASDAAALKLKSELAAVNRRAEVRMAIERREPLVGMTQDELLEAMGQPDRANMANYNGVPHNQLIYERGNRTLYVYTNAGVVTAIQNTESLGGTRRASVRCPSPMEIRSMETSASSITLSEAERAERLKQLDEARKCRQ